GAAAPAATLTSLSPSSAVAGGAAFTLTVNGTGFVNGATVRWNGQARTTTFVSGSQLTAAITASDIGVAGTMPVTVVNPGASASNALTFTITTQPAATLTSLSPSSAAAGGSGFTLTANGTGFVNGATVQWNGVARTTTFRRCPPLTSTIPASDIAVAGTSQVTVVNPGAAASNALTFTISPPAAATLTSLSPASAAVGGPGFTLTVNGTGFVSGATVQWNGAARTTTFGSSTQLTAAIPASDIAVAGTSQVTVVNPGASASNALTFTTTSGAPDTQPPTAPSGLTATAVGAAQINLSWTASTDTVGVTGYRVERCQGATCTNFGQIATPTGVSYTDPGLTASTTYRYQVRATDAAGNLSGYSTIASATTSPPAAATLTSLSPASAAAGGPGFTLTVNGTGFVSGATVQWNGAARTTTFGSSTQLTAAIPASDIAVAGTSQVTVVNPGASASNALTFTTTSGAPDTQPPTAPSGLTATAAGATQINLSWTASTDTVGVTGYRVERCQGATCTNFVQIGTSTGASYTDPGLAASTTYRYQVRATDAAGNLSGYSNMASAT